MTSLTNNPDDRPGHRQGDRFGGWPDYRQWARHDFRPMTPDDRPGPPARPDEPAPIVLPPIRLPETDFSIPVDADDAPMTCRVLTFPRKAEADMQQDSDFPDDDAGGSGDGGELDDSSLIRPYVRSGGRAEAAHELGFETVLTTTGLCDTLLRQNQLSGDQRAICEHCVVPQSVAEIAVAIEAPLGLATVLISDAIDAGLLIVHPTAPIIGGRPSMELLERVHAGIAKLA